MPFTWSRGPSETPSQFRIRCDLNLSRMGVEILNEFAGKHAAQVVFEVQSQPRKGTKSAAKTSFSIKTPPSPFPVPQAHNDDLSKPSGSTTNQNPPYLEVLVDKGCSSSKVLHVPCPSESVSRNRIYFRSSLGILPKALQDGYLIPDGQSLVEARMRAHMMVFNAHHEVKEEGAWNHFSTTTWCVEPAPDGCCG